MYKDSGLPLTKLNTDGKMSTNNLLMQLQADLCGTPVCKYIRNIISDNLKIKYSMVNIFLKFIMFLRNN